jgi:nucleoside-diphosphate-sugar epimerase
VINEEVPLTPPTNDSYGRNKLDAERALAAVAAKGLSTIVIRPTRIYGPFSRTFTMRPLQALAEGRLAIGGDSAIPANMVYVDNIVAAIERALEAPRSIGGSAFLITDPEQLTLAGFYNFFGAPAGLAVRLRPEWRQEAGSTERRGLLSGLRTIATSSELRGIVRRVLETDPIGTLPRRLWDRSPRFQTTMLRRFGADSAVVYRGSGSSGDDDLIYYGEAATVSSAKAHTVLGYTAPVGHNDAMTRTLEWARYARLLPGAAGPSEPSEQ